MLHKGKQVYDGKFNQLIKSVNPKRRLLFEFSIIPDDKFLSNLKLKYDFTINDNLLTAELPESLLKDLLSALLEKFSPLSLSFEDLPVEETMRSFFENPETFL